MRNKKVAVIIVESQKSKKGEYVPCIVKEGEQGYFLTDWTWGKDSTIANRLADEYNTGLGITKEEVIELVLKSIGNNDHN